MSRKEWPPYQTIAEDEFYRRIEEQRGYVERDCQGRRPLVLENYDLRKVDLKNEPLEHGEFIHVNLAGQKFGPTSLAQCYFRDCDLSYVEFDEKAAYFRRVEYDYDKTIAKVMKEAGLDERCGTRLVLGR